MADASGTETWRLDHPDAGRYEVVVGAATALNARDPDFPARDDDRPGTLVLRDGEPIARITTVGAHRVDAAAEPLGPDAEPTKQMHHAGRPRIDLRTGGLSEQVVRQVRYRGDGYVADFDPPPGSSAEARLNAIAASPWKRVVYPLLGGVGKAGWAIVVLVLGPLVSRLLEPVFRWLGSLLPDVDLPAIPLPSIPLPDVDLPRFDAPAWVDAVLDTAKIWSPLLIGLAAGVLAVRAARASRRTREAWARRRTDGSDDSEDAAG